MTGPVTDMLKTRFWMISLFLWRILLKAYSFLLQYEYLENSTKRFAIQMQTIAGVVGPGPVLDKFSSSNL